MTTWHIDFETRSAVDLPAAGLWRYSHDPSTDAWCMAYAERDNEPELWWPGQPCPIPADADVFAHNAPFELAIWNEVMTRRYGWRPLEARRTHCTLALAYAMGLPGALDSAALALGLPIHKDAEGRALMLKMAVMTAREQATAEQIVRLGEYCKQDVRVEQHLTHRLMSLSETERSIWLLDYKINQRGVLVDIESAQAATALAARVKEKANVDLDTLTQGQVKAITAVAAFKRWLASVGCDTDTLGKQAVADILNGECDYGQYNATIRKALVIRAESAKASTSKFEVMVRQAGADRRLHNMYQYHGAATGRFTARGVQTHNLVRNMPPAIVVEDVLRFVREGNLEAIDVLGAPLDMVSRCSRSFFVAPEGRLLVGGDAANVEGRGQAWFAGEDWKLKAFVAADNKTGPGIYELAYARMFNVPVESVKNPSEQRQIGKVSELAFGYQGGVGSFRTMAKSYPEISGKITDAKADEYKLAWRATHPKIKQTWRDIQDAAQAAVRTYDPAKRAGQPFTAGVPGRHATYKMAGSFLWCQLPSGRVICYPYPKLLATEYGDQLTYMTVPSPDDKKKGKIIDDPANSSNWARVGTYGGSLFNNIVQGFCRDLLTFWMLHLDSVGAQIVLHTHDDINIEVDEAKAQAVASYLKGVMTTAPAWATGFPLKADVKIMKRYSK